MLFQLRFTGFLHEAFNAVLYLLIRTSFCDKNVNAARNQRFLLLTKRKATNKTLDQRFLKEVQAKCKKSGESELKQQKVI